MSTFFSNIPNILVADPTEDASPSNHSVVKNLFRRSKVIPNVVKNFTYFQKYTIPGNARPYQVAYDVYGTAEYEWVILISNDITNVYEQWPLSQQEFLAKLRDVYGTRETETKYWRTKEVKDSRNNIIVPGGLIVPETYTYRLPNGEFIPKDVLIERVTNYEYEFELNESKRNIYLVFPSVVERFITEYSELMQYSKHEDLIEGVDNLKSPGTESFKRVV
jgi:hypothetical protein